MERQDEQVIDPPHGHSGTEEFSNRVIGGYKAYACPVDRSPSPDGD